MHRLAMILRSELERRHINPRQMAHETGLAYQTITRVLAELPVDIQTLYAICDWLEVELVDVLDQKPTDADLARQLAVLINREPELGKIFTAALAEVNAGTMDQEDLRDIIEYANYKLQHRRNRDPRQNAEEVYYGKKGQQGLEGNS